MLVKARKDRIYLAGVLIVAIVFVVVARPEN